MQINTRDQKLDFMVGLLGLTLGKPSEEIIKAIDEDIEWADHLYSKRISESVEQKPWFLDDHDYHEMLKELNRKICILTLKIRCDHWGIPYEQLEPPEPKRT